MLTGREYIQKLYSELDENDLVSELLDRAFSEGYEKAKEDISNGESVGKSLGIATAGGLGTVGAAKLGENVSKKIVDKKETANLRKDLKEVAKKVKKREDLANSFAKVKKNESLRKNNEGILEMLFRDKRNKKAEKAYKEAVSKNNIRYSNLYEGLKNRLTNNKNIKVSKLGKNVRNKILLGGGLLTLGTAGGSLVKDKLENKKR